MRPLFAFILFGTVLLAGCAERSLQSGEIVYVTLGDKPVMEAGQAGSWSAQTFTKGRVEVYGTWAVVIEPDGTRHVASLERFGIIRFK